MNFKIISIFLISSITLIDCANILAIFPVASQSNQIIYRRLTEALEDRGHKLTIISTDSHLGRNHTNTREIDLKFTHELIEKAVFSLSFKNTHDELSSVVEWFPYELEIVEKQLQSENVQELLNSDNKFDLVIVEFAGQTPFYAFAEHFNAPLIGITATETTLEFHEAAGNHANPIKDPDMLLRYTTFTNIKERFHAWHFYFMYNFFYKRQFHTQYDEIIRKYLPNVKSSSQQLKESASLLFTNTHPAMNYIRPILPTTIQLGFMHIQPPQEIVDNALRNYLDESEKPVIYMSLGTAIKSSDLNANVIEMFKKVFASLACCNVVWKWEQDEMLNKPENVFITKWTQQADLLAHSKVKLFITHGGQLSVEEAIDRAVPMIVIPFYSDHGTNALRVQQLQVGIALSTQYLNEQSLRKAIDEVMYGNQKQYAEKLSQIIHDVPMRPVEKALWWIEHVLRYNRTKNLQYFGTKVPFYQKYMLDFVAIAVLIWHAIVFILKHFCGIGIEKIVKFINERRKDKKVSKMAKKIIIKKNKKKGE